MASKDLEYSVDQEIATFFEQTSTTREACDNFATEQLGGDIVPVAVQGVCSYTVYAGPNAEFVAQFRLKSLQLKMDTANLARDIYGSFAPQVTFRGQLGEEVEGKEPLYIYVMSRMRGISYLDFILEHISQVPLNSPGFSSWRRSLVIDAAKYVWLSISHIHAITDQTSGRFFALSWNASQDVDQAYRDNLHRQYKEDLELLLVSLPDRFHPLVRYSLDSLPAVFSLPMVLLHKDFGSSNIMVDEKTCNIVGVVDWAEAKIEPFGMNLHSHQRLISQIHLKKGWIRFDDYVDLEEIFWSTFSKEAGELSDETVRVIKAARIVGLLRSRGFTSRLASAPKPVPVQDDGKGAYNMRDLDGLLINPATRFTDLT